MGPLDGQYAFREDGGVGYLHIRVMTAEYIEAKTGGEGPRGDLCAWERMPEEHETRTDRVRERLPDGRVLTTWRDSVRTGGQGTGSRCEAPNPSGA